jgi:hypothetical protein
LGIAAHLIHIQVLYSVSLAFIYVFVPVPCCFYWYGLKYQYSLKYGIVILPALLNYSVLPGYLWSFVFPDELYCWIFNLCDKCYWNFDRNCMNMYIAFGNTAIFTLLTLPIYGCLNSLNCFLCFSFAVTLASFFLGDSSYFCHPIHCLGLQCLLPYHLKKKFPLWVLF